MNNQLIIVLIVANVLLSYKGFNDIYFFNKYKFQINKIANGEYIRMLSSAFLHADWMHLGFNMYALWLFGKIVFISLGTINFIVIYFGSLLAGSLYTQKQHKNNPLYSAVGASGAVSGIIFSSILLYPEMKLMIFPIPINLPGYIFAVGYLAYSIYGMKSRLGNIGHSAHLGGAIGGYALTLLLYPEVFSNSKTLIIVIGAIILGLFLMGDKIRSA